MGQRYQLLFWNKHDHANSADEKFVDIGCTKQQVLEVCHNLIAVNKAAVEDEDAIIGDSGYVSYYTGMDKTSLYTSSSGSLFVRDSLTLSGCPRHVGRNYVPLLFGVDIIECRHTLLRIT